MNLLIKSRSLIKNAANLTKFYGTKPAEEIKKLLDNNKVVVFMKGVPEAPKCGFSNAVVQILRMHGVSYDSHNVLEDETLRQGKWQSHAKRPLDSQTLQVSKTTRSGPRSRRCSSRETLWVAAISCFKCTRTETWSKSSRRLGFEAHSWTSRKSQKEAKTGTRSRLERNDLWLPCVPKIV